MVQFQTTTTRMSLAGNRVLIIEKGIVSLQGRERYRDIRLPRKFSNSQTRVQWEHVAGDPDAGDRRFKFRRGLIVVRAQRSIPKQMVVIDPRTRRPMQDRDGERVYRTVNEHETYVVREIPACFDIELNRWVAVED